MLTAVAVWTEFEYGRWVDALTRSLEKVRDSNFLMDATVGFININQNKIIKIF